MFADNDGAELLRNMLSQQTLSRNEHCVYCVYCIGDPRGRFIGVLETLEVVLLEVIEIENNYTLLFESSW